MPAAVPRYFEEERICEECGERFWGTVKANFCGVSCRCRAWRKQRSMVGGAQVAELCAQVLERRTGAGASSKLYPRLFRALAAELRKSGWDPIELLMTRPDEPASDEDIAPGGFEGKAPERRRWLHAPEREVELLAQDIQTRSAEGRSVTWHQKRHAQLQAVLAARGTGAPTNAA